MKQCSISTKENLLYQKLSSLIEESRSHVAKAVNTAMVYTYYNVGLYIVEYEQEGNERATYGKALLQRFSARLTEKFGKGWSVETLNNCRKFFNVFSKSSTVYTKFENKPDTKLTADKDNNMNDEQKIIHKFTLSWNHYQILMRIKNQFLMCAKCWHTSKSKETKCFPMFNVCRVLTDGLFFHFFQKRNETM